MDSWSLSRFMYLQSFSCDDVDEGSHFLPWIILSVYHANNGQTLLESRND